MRGRHRPRPVCALRGNLDACLTARLPFLARPDLEFDELNAAGLETRLVKNGYTVGTLAFLEGHEPEVKQAILASW